MRALFALVLALLAVGLSSARTEVMTLFEAVAADDAAAISHLVASGADIEARDGHGRTALLAAVHADAVDAARALIDAGADVNAKDWIEDTPFLFAGAEGRTEILITILAAGAKLDDINRYGGTALIPAAEKGHLDNVKLLIAAGVDVDHVNRLGWTALLEAIMLSDGGPVQQEIVAALLAGGADPGIADGDGVTPLQHAERMGFGAIAALLREAGAAE